MTETVEVTRGRSTRMLTIAYLLYAVGTTLAAFGAWFIAIIVVAVALVVAGLYLAASATWHRRALIVTLGALLVGAAVARLLPEPAGGSDAERITAWAIVAWAIVLHLQRDVWLLRVAVVAVMIGIGYALPEPRFDKPNYQLILLLAIPLVLITFNIVARRMTDHSTEKELLEASGS